MSGIIFFGGDIIVVTPIMLVWLGTIFGIVFFAIGSFTATLRSERNKK